MNKRQRKKAWKLKNHIPYGYRVLIDNTCYGQIVVNRKMVDVAIMPRYMVR